MQQWNGASSGTPSSARTRSITVGCRVVSTDPSQLTLRFVGDAHPVELFSTAQFHGMVYGPGARISVGAPFEVYGALVGRALDLDPGVRLHFDSGLGSGSGRLPLPKLISWDVTEVPAGLKSRQDAFTVMGMKPTDLEAPSDAAETLSWTVEISYSGWGGEDVEYEGPFEEWDPAASQGFPQLEELTPPDVEFSTPWLIDVEYSHMWQTKTYSGELGQVPQEALYYVKSMTITPPAELLAAGRDTYTWVRQ